MSAVQTSPLVDEITEFLASVPSAEQIIAFKLSDQLESRALDLLERSRSNKLAKEERAEMDEFLKMNHFINMLKLKTRLKLAGDK
jgi:hypothetical protein